MIVTIGVTQLKSLIIQQVRHNFLLNNEEEIQLLSNLPTTLERTKACLSAINNKYYVNEEGIPKFHPYHSGQYTIFLYFLSQELWKSGHQSLADRTYFLNKMLNGIDMFYQIELPDIFFHEHPVGTVLGRAKYSKYFIYAQNCTVGGNHCTYPTLGEHVRLFANATVIGDSTLGNNVFVSANSFIKDQDIPDNTIVFGSSPNLTLKNRPPEYFEKLSPFGVHHPTAK